MTDSGNGEAVIDGRTVRFERLEDLRRYVPLTNRDALAWLDWLAP